MSTSQKNSSDPLDGPSLITLLDINWKMDESEKDITLNNNEKTRVNITDLFRTSATTCSNRFSTDDDVQMLPRVFHQHGSYWDLKLSSMDYGTDVVLVSRSPSESSFKSICSSWREIKNRLMSKCAPPMMETSFPYQFAPRSRLRLRRRAPKKRRIGYYGPKTEAGIAVMREFDGADGFESYRNNNPSETKASRDYRATSRLSKTSFHRPSTDDQKYTQIFKRPTVERFSSVDERRSRRYSRGLSLGGRLSMDDNISRFVDEVRRLTRELGSMDLARHITLQSDLMDNNCCILDNGKRALTLQGKLISEKTGRRIQDKDLPYIFQFLINNSDVEYLDLSYNCITASGMDQIMNFLTWTSTLKGLNLMNNDIVELNFEIVDTLCGNTSLKSLRINGNSLGEKSAEYLAYLLMFKELEHLDMGQTDQTVSSLAWISQAVIKADHLKVLDLSRVLGQQCYNCDTLSTALIFSDILRVSSSLVELHLKTNNLNDTDIEELMFGLSFNKKLELLDLGCNRVGNRGAELLAKAFDKGAPLRALILESNMIGNIGARALSLALPSSRIQMLDVSFNKIEDQGIVDIVYSVNKMPYPILALFIFGNKIRSRSLEFINSKLASHKLNPNSIDLTIWFCEGEIGHSRKIPVNRYRSRYYRVPGTMKPAEFKPDGDSLKIPDPSQLNYTFHNVFQPYNAANGLNNNLPTSLGPPCPI